MASTTPGPDDAAYQAALEAALRDAYATATPTPHDQIVPDLAAGGALPARVAPAVSALPGLSRVAASAALHTTGWGVRAGARTGRRFLRAMTNADEAGALVRDASQAVEVVGTLARSISAGVPLGKALLRAGESIGEIVEHQPVVITGAVSTVPRQPPTLRARGQALLDKSRDVWSEDRSHPAYDRILDELAPDEARILLLLLRGGPQPSVDVRTGGPVGIVNSELIAPGLNMIGARAGCRYLDQVPAYLNNLSRLGLAWFSREPLKDPLEYQVLEAQPDVLEALHSVRFAKVVRRSIHLTPFGEDFCRLALVDEATAASAAFPQHEAPPEQAGDSD